MPLSSCALRTHLHMAAQYMGIEIHIQLNVGMCHLRFIGVGLQEENRMVDQSTSASLAHGSEGQLGMQAAAPGSNWHHNPTCMQHLKRQCASSPPASCAPPTTGGPAWRAEQPWQRRRRRCERLWVPGCCCLLGLSGCWLSELLGLRAMQQRGRPRSEGRGGARRQRAPGSRTPLLHALIVRMLTMGLLARAFGSPSVPAKSAVFAAPSFRRSEPPRHPSTLTIFVERAINGWACRVPLQA